MQVYKEVTSLLALPVLQRWQVRSVHFHFRSASGISGVDIGDSMGELEVGGRVVLGPGGASFLLLP